MDVEKVVKYGAVIVAALTALAYGVLRTAYVQFYSAFRILPEQAGVDKSDLLSQALIGPLVLLVLISSAIFLMWHFFISRRVDRQPNTVALLAASLLIGLIGTFIWMSVLADSSAHSVVWHHESLLTRYLGVAGHDFSLPLLEVEAVPARIEWVGASPEPDILRTGAECLAYLGETEDTIVVYDEADGRTVFLPKSDAVVELHTHASRLPADCPPRAPEEP